MDSVKQNVLKSYIKDQLNLTTFFLGTVLESRRHHELSQLRLQVVMKMTHLNKDKPVSLPGVRTGHIPRTSQKHYVLKFFTLPNFRLTPQCKSDICSSGTLRSSDWQQHTRRAETSYSPYSAPHNFNEAVHLKFTKQDGGKQKYQTWHSRRLVLLKIYVKIQLPVFLSIIQTIPRKTLNTFPLTSATKLLNIVIATELLFVTAKRFSEDCQITDCLESVGGTVAYILNESHTQAYFESLVHPFH